ncbi:MAG: proprotein convertase P-domain-containing protein [Myxococcota bacterium]|nr:proprotein convertase P-domain-containing protein [Myxococcota bacterium]
MTRAFIAFAIVSLATVTASAKTYTCDAGQVGLCTCTNSITTPNAPMGCDNRIVDGFDTLTSTLLVVDSECPSEVGDVNLRIAIRHPQIGDLTVRLTSPSGDSATVLLRPGLETGELRGCPFDDLDVTFDDESETPYGQCEYLIPAMSGVMRGISSLSALDGGERNGLWTLTVQDTRTSNSGSLVAWSLDIPCQLPDLTMQVLDDLTVANTQNGALVRFVREGDTTAALPVFLDFDGDASTEDFATPLSARVVIPAGATSVDMPLQAVNDADGDELLIVKIRPGDYAIDGPEEGTVRIDGAAPGDDDGCGCRSASRGDGVIVAALLGAWLFMRRRRH